jgi:DNA-binding winged helix-turn-helix (wHTH) protein
MSTTASGAEPRYEVQDLLIDLAQRRVVRDGVVVDLSALNFDLLRVLVESAPNVVTYDELAEKVWGRHFVSPENIAQRVKMLRQTLSDDANEPRYVETVRGRGYRLIPSALPASDAPPPARGDVRRRPIALATVAVIAVVALSALGGAVWLARSPQPASGARTPLPRSVAVLPLKNLSPDPADAYFAAGIHEEIIGRLANRDR